MLNRMPDRISVDPDICNGKPCVRGTRISVQSMLEFLAAGDTPEGVLDEFPTIGRRQDISACLDYASKVMANHYSVVAVE